MCCPNWTQACIHIISYIPGPIGSLFAIAPTHFLEWQFCHPFMHLGIMDVLTRLAHTFNQELVSGLTSVTSKIFSGISFLMAFSYILILLIKMINWTMTILFDRFGDFRATRLRLSRIWILQFIWVEETEGLLVRHFVKEVFSFFLLMECYDTHFAGWRDLKFCCILFRTICSYCMLASPT